MDKIQENHAEAWGYIASKVNEIVDFLNENVKKKRTPEELRELRIENLKKARQARG